MHIDKDITQGSMPATTDFNTRRKFLAAFVASAGSIVLAACGGGESDTPASVAERQRRARSGSGASGTAAASSTTAASTPASTNSSSTTSGVLLDTSFGVKGDGKTNDRVALQAAIDGSVGQILMITGKSRIDMKGLDLRSKSHIRFASGASIKLLPYNSQDYQVLRVWDVDGVIIENAYIDGSKELNSATTGEWGHGISINGATNLTIESPTTINTWGDGIYVDNSCTGSNAYSRNITINNHHAIGCRRQGMSIGSVSGLTLNSPIWENIGGTAPGAGLDIEPDNNLTVLDNIVINNPTSKNCAGPGIQVYLWNFSSSVKKTVSISIKNHTDVSSKVSAFSVLALRNGSNVTGSVTSANPVWNRPLAQSYIFADWDSAGPKVSVTNPKIVSS